MVQSSIGRREFLVTSGALGAVGLAGCSGSGDQSDGGGGATAADGATGTTESGSSSDFPSRPVTEVIPSESGGVIDRIARSLNPHFRDALGVNVVLENRPGAGTRSGSNYVYRQESDGYTIGFNDTGIMYTGQAFYDTAYDMAEITPIGVVTRMYLGLFGGAGRWADFSEFMDWAENADQITLASHGRGASTHFTALVTLDDLGIDISKVKSLPQDGGAGMAAAVARGDADISAQAPASAISFVNDDRIAPVLILRPDDSPTYPDAPTFADLEGEQQVLPVFFSLFGPPGIPDDRVAVLTEAMKEAVEAEEFQSFIGKFGMTAPKMGPEEMRETMEQTSVYAEQYKEMVE